MKVCPKCGFVDPPMWRQRRSWGGLNEEVCNYDDFIIAAPELAERIKGGAAKTKDANYVYRLVVTRVAKRFGGGLVVRTYIPEAQAAGSRKRIQAEKPSHFGGYTEA